MGDMIDKSLMNVTEYPISSRNSFKNQKEIYCFSIFINDVISMNSRITRVTPQIIPLLILLHV